MRSRLVGGSLARLSTRGWLPSRRLPRKSRSWPSRQRLVRRLGTCWPSSPRTFGLSSQLPTTRSGPTSWPSGGRSSTPSRSSRSPTSRRPRWSRSTTASRWSRRPGSGKTSVMVARAGVRDPARVRSRGAHPAARVQQGRGDRAPGTRRCATRSGRDRLVGAEGRDVPRVRTDRHRSGDRTEAAPGVVARRAARTSRWSLGIVDELRDRSPELPVQVGHLPAAVRTHGRRARRRRARRLRLRHQADRVPHVQRRDRQEPGRADDRRLPVPQRREVRVRDARTATTSPTPTTRSTAPTSTTPTSTCGTSTGRSTATATAGRVRGLRRRDGVEEVGPPASSARP